jgi:hypothetical protein
VGTTHTTGKTGTISEIITATQAALPFRLTVDKCLDLLYDASQFSIRISVQPEV